MTGPTLTDVERWRPDELRDIAAGWDAAAGALSLRADALVQQRGALTEHWAGSSADSAVHRITEIAVSAARLARAAVAAAVAARTGADRITADRNAVLAVAAASRADGFTVAADGTVTPPDAIDDTVRILSGGDATGARAVMSSRATELTAELTLARNRLGATDRDAAADIAAAFADATASPAQATRPAGAWPVEAIDVVRAWPAMSQGGIAAQIAEMTPTQRRQLVDAAPAQVGNTDGVPWELRAAANRVNIADAILAERRIVSRPDDDKLRAIISGGFGSGPLDPAAAERVWAAAHADPRIRAAALAQHDRAAQARIAFYEGLLAEVPDPTGRSAAPVARQILAFDPARSSLVELTGDLASARSVGVLVPGLNTTIASSAEETEMVRRFVTAGHGDVAMISYLGGPFPTGFLAAGIADAAEPRYALEMAPRLVAFSEDVDRTVDATGRAIPVTYIGHSYGGSILGTAESLGLTADRTIYVEAAGAGVGVDEPGDWHNRNPDVLRFSMTAPGDPIALVQGNPLSPHGADPDELPGVVRLDTGRRLDGSTMRGLAAHSDVLSEPSDAWRNILAVITGDAERLHLGATS